MDSRLLTNLNTQASTTRDPVIWAMAVCRAASHFASHGRTAEAIKSIKVVREQFGKDLHFDIASWLMLAEGVLHYFQAQTFEAYDRIRRAYGLAIALQNNSALPSCAAWMAHMEFYDGKYIDMAKHIEEALERALSNDHQAIARSSLVLATAYHVAGEFQLARPWYESARLNAAAEGDDATISATLHNMASFRAANLRLDDAFGEAQPGDTRRANLEASSSITYDYAVDHRGLDFLSRMLRGLLFTIDKKFESALEEFGRVDESAVPLRLMPLIKVDRAWCHANTGNSSTAWQLALEIPGTLSNVSDDDDLAYINCRLSQISAICGQDTLANDFKGRADTSLLRHRKFQSELLETISGIKINAQKKSPA